MEEITHYGVQTMQWSYDLDETHPDVVALVAGQTLVDTVTVTLFDNIPQNQHKEIDVDIDITIVGGGPILGYMGDDSTMVDEGQTNFGPGLFAYTDVSGTQVSTVVYENGEVSSRFSVADAGSFYVIAPTAPDISFSANDGLFQTLSVQSFDAEGNFSYLNFTVEVIDSYEPISYVHFPYSFHQFLAPEEVWYIGDLQPYGVEGNHGTNPADTVTYEITGPAASYFTIDPFTGGLYWAQRPDYETLGGGSRDITVTATEIPGNGEPERQATVDVRVNLQPVDEPVGFLEPAHITVDSENGNVVTMGMFAYADPEGATVNDVIVRPDTTYGSLWIDAHGRLRFHPNLDHPEVAALPAGERLIDIGYVDFYSNGYNTVDTDIVTITIIGAGVAAEAIGPTTISVEENVVGLGTLFSYRITNDAAETTEIRVNGFNSGRFVSVATADPDVFGVQLASAGDRFDHETDGTVEVTVELRDARGHSYALDYVIEVADAYEDVSYSNLWNGSTPLAVSAPEEQAFITNLLPSGIDVDFGDVVTYEISGPNAHLFSIDNLTGDLFWVDVPDYELLGSVSYALTVTAHEFSTGSTSQLSDSINVIVTLAPVAEPVVLQDAPEWFAEYNQVGAISRSFTGVNPDTGGEGFFAPIIGNQYHGTYGTVTITGQLGDGTVQFDYDLDETHPDVTSIATGRTIIDTVSFTSLDSRGLEVEADLSFIIRGPISFGPMIDAVEDLESLSIAENVVGQFLSFTATGYFGASVSAEDITVYENDLVSSRYFVAALAGVTNGFGVSVLTPFDFEAMTSTEFTLEVIDSVGQVSYLERQQLSILDRDDSPPEFDPVGSSSLLNYKAGQALSAGHLVLDISTLVSLSAIQEATGMLTYSISGGHAELFSVDAQTGQVTLLQDIAQLEDRYDFTISVTTAGGQTASVPWTVFVPAGPTIIVEGGNGPVYVDENSVGDLVRIFTATPDLGKSVDFDNILVSLDGVVSDALSVFSLPDDNYALLVDTPFDYEADDAHQVSVDVPNNYGEVSHFTFELYINDVDEAASNAPSAPDIL